jgi:hypothetical protein
MECAVGAEVVQGTYSDMDARWKEGLEAIRKPTGSGSGKPEVRLLLQRRCGGPEAGKRRAERQAA